METKVCNLCNEKKSFDLFEIGRNQCEECLREQAKINTSKRAEKRNKKPSDTVAWCNGHKKWLLISAFQPSEKFLDKLESNCSLCKDALKLRIEKRKQTIHILPLDYTKKCNNCEEKKTTNAFTVLKQNSDGLHNTCKQCSNKMAALRKENYATPPSNYKKTCQNKNCLHKGQSLIAADNFRHSSYCKDTYYSYCKACESRYQKSSEGRKAHNRAVSNYFRTPKGKLCAKQRYERNKLNCKARRAVAYAVEKGFLMPARNFNCYDCALKGKQVQAHSWHHIASYDKRNWLTIIQLCWPCHIKRDSTD